MRYAYHRRLKFQRTVWESARLCIGAAVLFAVDCALFAMGHDWQEIRHESRRIWK